MNVAIALLVAATSLRPGGDMRDVSMYVPPLAESASAYDPDAAAYIAAVEAADGQALEDGVKTAINDFVVGCKTDGIWDAIKSSAILAGARTLSGAVQPLAGTAPTNFNFVSGDYDRRTGLKGDGATKYLSTNRANNADPQDDNHNAFFVTEAATTGLKFFMGSDAGGATGANNFLQNTDNRLYVRNRSSTYNNTGVSAFILGFKGFSRDNSANYTLRDNGISSVITRTSEVPSASIIQVFDRGPTPPNSPSDARISFYSIGESLDLALLDTRVSALMTAIDGAIPLTIDAMPYERTVTCDTYTVTGTFVGSAPTGWSASPSGDTGSCTDTGGGTFSCVVDVDPDASGEGVETITIGSETVDIGFYVAGSHSCFLAQSVDGNYNSTLADNDPVATWQNLGTSALDVTQATAANQPAFKTSIVGGSPVVRCDGGDSVSAATASDWDFMNDGSDYTIGSVFINNGTNYTIASTRTSNVDGFVLAGTTTTPRFEVDDGALVVVGVASVSTMTSGLWHSQVAALDDDGSTGDDAFLYLDGALHATGAATMAYPTSAGRALLFGIGRLAGSAQITLTGDLFRVLIYQSALDATQRDINQAVDEWALGGTFPVTP